MKTSLSLILLRSTMLLMSPLAMSTAGAGPAPTLLRLEPEPFEKPTAVMLTTDRCIALVKARDFAAASAACDSAIAAAQRSRTNSWSTSFMSNAYDERIAIAYNNRAVLNYLSGRLALATADATRARRAAQLPGIDSTVAVISAARRRAGAVQD
jgi:hypothetical protein